MQQQNNYTEYFCISIENRNQELPHVDVPLFGNMQECMEYFQEDGSFVYKGVTIKSEHAEHTYKEFMEKALIEPLHIGLLYMQYCSGSGNQMMYLNMSRIEKGTESQMVDLSVSPYQQQQNIACANVSFSIDGETKLIIRVLRSCQLRMTSYIKDVKKNLSFGDAVKAVTEYVIGVPCKVIKRGKWQNKVVYLADSSNILSCNLDINQQTASSVIDEHYKLHDDLSAKTKPMSINMASRFDMMDDCTIHTNWLPTFEDIVANDWEILN